MTIFWVIGDDWGWLLGDWGWLHVLVKPNFRTGIHHTFHRYEHCFLELSRPQTKTEGTT